MAILAQPVAALTLDLPELSANFSIVGFGGSTNSGIALWAFKDWSERDRSQAEIQGDLQGRLSAITGVQAFVFGQQGLIAGVSLAGVKYTRIIP